MDGLAIIKATLERLGASCAKGELGRDSRHHEQNSRGKMFGMRHHPHGSIAKLRTDPRLSQSLLPRENSGCAHFTDSDVRRADGIEIDGRRLPPPRPALDREPAVILSQNRPSGRFLLSTYFMNQFGFGGTRDALAQEREKYHTCGQ